MEQTEAGLVGPLADGARIRLVTQKTTQAALDASLYQLRQKSGQMYNDYGLWVLWLGVGMLDWREADAHESSSAPSSWSRSSCAATVTATTGCTCPTNRNASTIRRWR